jgi:hypothetical protein
MKREELVRENFELSREIGYQNFLATNVNRDDPVLVKLNPEERITFLRNWWDAARERMFDDFKEMVANMNMSDLLSQRESYIDVLDTIGMLQWREESRNSLGQILADNAETDKRKDMGMKTIRFGDWDCVVEKSQYYDGRPALILKDVHDGEMVTVATVNLPDVAAGPNEVFIKNYSENEGVLKALLEGGIIKLTGENVNSGFVTIPKVELLPPFRERSLSEMLDDKTASPTQQLTEQSKDNERER